MEKMELNFAHSRTGKQELLELIDRCRENCRKPTPLPEYEGVTKISWPKPVVLGGCKVISGLLTDHNLWLFEGTWHIREGLQIKQDLMGNLDTGNLRAVKARLEAHLLGTSNAEEDDTVAFTSSENNTVMSIPNDLYHLTNFYEVVRKSTKTYFYKTNN